jgi:hypothetical protein
MTQMLTATEQYELLYPEMGYMALLKNLRKLDEAGLGDTDAKIIQKRLGDPGEVAKSRQLPFQFYTAWLNVNSGRWRTALNKALNASLGNVPTMDGRSLILIDTSGSMGATMSNPHPGRRRTVFNSGTGRYQENIARQPRRVDAAALFGIAVAMANPGNVDVYGFATDQMAVNHIANSGKTLLQVVDMFGGTIGRVGHGTDIQRAVTNTYKGHDRVLIFTDMQTMAGRNGDVARDVPKDKHVYGFDLSGYQNTALDTSASTRHEMAGLGDYVFDNVPRIEAGAAEKWPF